MREESKISRINRIIETAEKAIGEDFSDRIEVSGKNDEIDKLAITINQMVEVLREHHNANKQTEAVKRNSKEKYRRLEANIRGMVFLFAMHPNGTYSFPYVNEASQRLFDISPGKLMRDANLLLRLIHPG